jgi:hypothetical protein
LAQTARCAFHRVVLLGCAQGLTGQAQAPHAPYPPDNNGIRPERGGGDGGGAAACSLARRCGTARLFGAGEQLPARRSARYGNTRCRRERLP